mgnify:CR=1 FL=1
MTRNNIMLKRLGAAAFSVLLVWSMPGTSAFAEGVAEYQKRLAAFAAFRILELPEEKIEEIAALLDKLVR